MIAYCILIHKQTICQSAFISRMNSLKYEFPLCMSSAECGSLWRLHIIKMAEQTFERRKTHTHAHKTNEIPAKRDRKPEFNTQKITLGKGLSNIWMSHKLIYGFPWARNGLARARARACIHTHQTYHAKIYIYVWVHEKFK